MSACNSVPHRFSASQNFQPTTAASASGVEHRTTNLMKQLCDISYFFRTLGIQLRFGRLSRAPLRMLRVGLEGSAAECDWVARPADPWDADLPRPLGDRHASAQALEDAIAVRDLLFCAMPGVNTAAFRVYRESAGADSQLIIAGRVTREQSVARSIRSLAMRAKLLGLQFWLEDGILEALRSEECAMSF